MTLAAGLTLAAWLAVVSGRLGLRWLDRRYRAAHAGEAPPELGGAVDRETLLKARAYFRDRDRVGLAQTLAGDAVGAVLIFGGLLGAVDRALAPLDGHPILRGVLLFLGLSAASALLDLPFATYRTFRVEARHGFNTTTPRLFVVDWIKAGLVGAVVMGGLAAGALALAGASPDLWWLWVWLLVTAVSVGLSFVSPWLIEPLFFKFEPLRDPALSEAVQDLARRAGLPVARVLQVDASRRSRHSNAYFTGIGRTRRVVLFDTLLDRLAPSEVVAVLAHEAGHWKLGHIRRRMVGTVLMTLGMLVAAWAVLRWDGLPGLVGLDAASFPARVVIVGFLSGIPGFLATPIASALSRRHERQADAFAARLTGRPADLASALVALARDNLSELQGHPLHRAFYDSHPPVAERVRVLRAP